MDRILLAEATDRLEQILQRYSAVDAEAKGLLTALSSLIASIRSGKITAPLEWRDIPGAYSFMEGGLGKYSDLETAYAKFRIEVTGGESPVLRNLRLGTPGKS